MRRHRSTELVAFLQAIGQELDTDVTIVVIGGSAIALAYASDVATADIDLWGNPAPQFWEAVGRAALRAASIPISVVGIASPPLDFEDRLVRISTGRTGKLTILVPEAHDLALLKVSRAEEHDIAAIAAVHSQQALDLQTLIARYRETLTQVIGPPSRFRLNFLALVERLFGEDAALEVEVELG